MKTRTTLILASVVALAVAVAVPPLQARWIEYREARAVEAETRDRAAAQNAAGIGLEQVLSLRGYDLAEVRACHAGGWTSEARDEIPVGLDFQASLRGVEPTFGGLTTLHVDCRVTRVDGGWRADDFTLERGEPLAAALDRERRVTPALLSWMARPLTPADAEKLRLGESPQQVAEEAEAARPAGG